MSRILALDFETGGIDAQRHAPVTLAVAVMEGEVVLAEKEWLFGRLDNIEPKFKRRAYEFAALEICQISMKRIMAEGLPEAKVLQEFRAFVKEHDCSFVTVVSHNACFDQAFFSDWLFRCGAFDRSVDAYVPQRSPLGGPWACTMRLAQQSLSLPDYKLDTVANAFGLSRTSTTHGATEDCILAGKIYHELTKQKLPAQLSA